MVALDRSYYINKVETILVYRLTYEIDNIGCNNLVVEKLKSVLKIWKSKYYLSNIIYLTLFITSANIARAYANQKIHKHPLSYRLIVSSTSSPIHNISTFMYILIRKSLNGETHFTVKNYFVFIKLLSNLNLQYDHILMSLDVVSLFNSLPHNLVIEK